MMSYQKDAIRTKSEQFHFKQTQENCDLLHGAIGIATEGGELLDALKKSMFYGADLDKNNVKEELGDVLWYVAIMCEALGTNMDNIMDMNIAKLKARYPEKFTTDDALQRDLKQERNIIDKKAAAGA